MKHHHRYVLKTGKDKTREAMVLGNACHGAIEQWYLAEEEMESPQDWLDVSWEHLLLRDKLSGVWPELKAMLLEPQALVAELYRRASATYTGPNAIRNGGRHSGSDAWKNPVSTNPERTTAWKTQSESIGLTKLLVDLNPRIQKLTKGVYEYVDLPKVYGQSLEITQIYQHPKEIVKVVGLEYPISEPTFWPKGSVHKGLQQVRNPVEFYRFTDALKRQVVVYLQGSIDLAGFGQNDDLIFVDHKSGAKDVSPLEVMHHAQLLTYSVAAKVLFPERPVKRIGINNLQSGNVFMCDVDWEYANHVWKDIMKADQSSRISKIFCKHDPFEYNSPCMNYDKKLQVAKEPCFALGHCHPHVAKALKLPLPEAPAPVKV